MSAVHRRLLRLAPGARRRLALAVACGLVGAVALVIQAASLARIVDALAFSDHDAATGGLGRAVTTALIVLGAVVLVRALAAAATEWLGRRAAEDALAALRRRVAEHVLSARVRRVDDARRGELATAAVHGVDALGEYYAKAVPQIVLAAIVPPALVVVLLWHDPVVAVLLGLTIPLVVVFMVLVGRTSAARIAERRVALGVLGSHFLDVVRGLPTLRAHGRMEAQAATLAEIGERYRLESVAALRVAFLSALVLELLAMVGTAIAAAVVGVQLAGGSLGFESGLFVLLLAPEVYMPLRLAGQRYHAAEDGAAAATTLLEVLDSEVERAPASAGGDPLREPLEVRGVQVDGGAGRPPALDGADVTFAPGRITALIGASGAGKSTLLALLAALREPDRGAVTCGGLALGGEAWWPRVAWLGQRPAVLRGPLRDTLTLQRDDATGAEIELALRRAGALEIVAELPHGLDTLVGAGGRPLAGGQTQRLALAGALLSDAPLLLLDEPTAHLDPDAALAAAAGIREAAAGRTTVIATHDPAVMAICDEIVELHAGRVLHPVTA
ncbi:thiol reductant ABC exporter subunit CydD [Solirubrobacter ginsenosidimutans]|uniref:thiol reductant ABC exporter subunit CydD n=1 Tax=Solirubrobacter ginsenosidimutans TaxID=490573 RepID=UPI0022CE31FC|nr:thiol reductant ABC exporter subunit CydD [Solirubrobacter ginsenosidimutans]